MSDIFISYTSEDRAKAECLANALEQQGWSVWWDRTIPAGKTFDVIIEEAIDAAKCVVVLWSNISVTSRWVRTEAEEEAHRKAKEEKANQAQADAKSKAERLAEEEKRKQVEDAERGRQESAEQRKVKEEAAKRETAFEAKSRADKEERQKAEKQRHADLKEKQKAEEARKSVEEDATRAPKETPASQKKYLVLGIGATIVAAIFSAVLIMNRPIPLSEDMIEIPAGCFQMGGEEHDDEKPIHRVCVGRFAIGKYEVTFDQYDRFAEAAGRGHPEDMGWGRGSRPVINVTWDDAVAYAEWLSIETDKRYRLPTEAEWEYAARAQTTTNYWWGDNVSGTRANCLDCGSQWDNKQTAPVGSFDPNPFSLHDTAGNVWEWVQDCYHENYKGAPDDGSVWEESNCNERVIRGGSWTDDPEALRSVNRYGNTPDDRSDYVGFRLAQDL